MNVQQQWLRRSLGVVGWLPVAVVLMGFPGCYYAPTPTKPDNVVRFWSFSRIKTNGEERIGAERVQRGGKVNETIEFGALVLFPPFAGPNAKGDVFSNEGGTTYWVSAQAPSVVLGPGVTIGSGAQLTQYQHFMKTDAKATLTVVVSKAFMEAIDENRGLPTALECPWHRPGGNFFDCRKVMWAWVDFHLEAFSFLTNSTFLQTGGFAELSGFGGDFRYDAYTKTGSTRSFWKSADFGFEPDVEGDGGGHAVVGLAAPITIEIPLSTIQVGDTFSVMAALKAVTSNHRQRESYLSAYLRDPQGANGLQWAYSGLEPLETPATKPLPSNPLPAAACPSGPDPEAGLLAFEADTFDEPELAGDGATVVITRSGGSKGAVSALLSTADGTALAGTDYLSVSTPVLFADGESGSRAIRIPLVPDDLAEPDKTVVLTLSDPRGCAALGAQDHATLNLLDDDRPLTLITHTVGGTVSGLLGTGLILEEAIGGFQVTPGNGPFVFGEQKSNGSQYQVRVATQPSNPLQVCTVANGTGSVGDADVTDVTVTCTTPPPPGGLDVGFGTDGRVTEGVPGGAAAIALQADGKILIVGGLTLARYTAGGTLDSTFGSGGKVTIAFNGGLLDEGLAVAVQPDGRIVVAGVTRVGTQNDFALARYESNGAPDTGFGTGGKVATDVAGSDDEANALVLQPDGKLLVAGYAIVGSGVTRGKDFAVVRYEANGTPDGSFGTGGKVTIDIAGKTDLPAAMALQPDGRIVIVGRVAPDGGSDPDTGLVRLDANGTPDESFGTHGIVRIDLAGSGWDEATGVVVQPDGLLLVSVEMVVGVTFDFAVARFTTTGALDLNFGVQGVASTGFAADHDVVHGLALQADGSVVLVGQASNGTAPDFGVVRYTPAGALDTGFGTGGKLTIDFFGSSDAAICVAIQPDGRLLVAGVARNGTSTGLGLVRLVP